MKQRPISSFIDHHYRHFNAATLRDAARAYIRHLDDGGQMMVTLAGAMSTGELGLSLAEMIRQDKVQIITCTGANLEEDVFNLVAHDYYERIPHYRDLTPQDEQALLDRHLNRVTDTCIPEEEAMRRIERAVLERWRKADPTVIYGLGDTFDGDLLGSHLRDPANPYNSYRHHGLPPTPIALPGAGAIHAALHPEPGAALYFVARGDGGHVFSDTLAEHREAVRKYQLQRRSDYRSSPGKASR